MNGIVRVPAPVNEPVLSYAPGSPERAALKRRLAEMANTGASVVSARSLSSPETRAIRISSS